MGIRSPLWGRSHIDGCSKGPSRPRGGDYWQRLFVPFSIMTRLSGGAPVICQTIVRLFFRLTIGKGCTFAA